MNKLKNVKLTDQGKNTAPKKKKENNTRTKLCMYDVNIWKLHVKQTHLDLVLYLLFCNYTLNMFLDFAHRDMYFFILL